MNKDIGIFPVILVVFVVFLIVGVVAYGVANEPEDPTVQQIEVDDWQVSNSPTTGSGLFLDAYGDEEKTSTYVRIESSTPVQITGWSISEMDGKKEVVISGQNSKEGDLNNTFRVEVLPSDINSISLQLEDKQIKTGICGCVTGDY